MKVVYNTCFGGFGLSHEAMMRYAELKGIPVYPEKDDYFVRYWTCPPEQRLKEPKDRSDNQAWHEYNDFVDANTLPLSYELDRADPILVQVVEELGGRASGECSKLAIADIPAGTLWRIDEYDGRETIATQDSYEWRIAV